MIRKLIVVTSFVGVVAIIPGLCLGQAPAPPKSGTIIARGKANIVQEKDLPEDPSKVVAQLEIFQNDQYDIILAKTDQGSVVVSRNKLLGKPEYWQSGLNIVNSKYVKNGMSTEYHVLFPLYSVLEYEGMYNELKAASVNTMADGIEVVYGEPSQNNSIVTPQTKYKFIGNNIALHKISVGSGNAAFDYLIRENELFDGIVPKKYRAVIKSIVGDRREIFNAEVVLDSFEQLQGNADHRKFLLSVTDGMSKLAPGTARGVANNRQLGVQMVQKKERSMAMTLRWAGLALLASAFSWIIFSKIKR